MIQKIAEYFDTKIAATGWIEKFFPLVVLLASEEKKFPAFYKGKGQYSHVSNFDNYNGLAYLRQTTPPVSSPIQEPTSVCGIEMDTSYSLRLVYCIQRSKLKIDDAFSEDAVANFFIKELTTKNGSIKSSLKASSVNIYAQSWEIDPVAVVAEEYAGSDVITINSEFIYGAINFNVNVVINKNCIPNFCDDPCYAS